MNSHVSRLLPVRCQQVLPWGWCHRHRFSGLLCDIFPSGLFIFALSFILSICLFQNLRLCLTHLLMSCIIHCCMVSLFRILPCMLPPNVIISIVFIICNVLFVYGLVSAAYITMGFMVVLYILIFLCVISYLFGFASQDLKSFHCMLSYIVKKISTTRYFCSQIVEVQ